MSSVNVREIVNEALKRGLQVNPDVIKFIENNPEYASKVLSIIMHKKKGNDVFLTLKDVIGEDNSNLVNNGSNVTVSIGRSYSDGQQLLRPEEISLMLTDRLERLKSLWSLRPENINFISLQYLKRQFKGYRWTFALIMKRGEDYLLLDDGKSEITIKVSERKILSEAVLGTAAAFKVKFDDEPVIEEMSDVELPEVREFKAYEGKIAALSGINEGSADNEKLFKRLETENIDGVIFLGDLIDRYALLNKGLLPAHGYEQLVTHLERLPKKIFKIIIPGNQDETNIGLPQKPIGFKLIKDTSKISNLRSLGNPSEIKINDLQVLLYNGQGLKCYSGFDEEYAIKKMLKTRHLCPTPGIVPFVVSNKDKLIIENRPDVFLISNVNEAHDIIYHGIWSVAVPPFSKSRRYGILDFKTKQSEWVYVD